MNTEPTHWYRTYSAARRPEPTPEEIAQFRASVAACGVVISALFWSVALCGLVVAMVAG